MSRESIIDKIRNLMKRTSEKGCSEAEVEAAMKIARNMMDKHQVEMADLMEAQKREYTLDDIVEQVVRTHCKIDKWERSMAQCVCMMTDTKCYTTEVPVLGKNGKWTKQFRMTYYGERQDVDAAHALYVELLIVFKAMARHRLGAKWTQAHYHYMEGFGRGMLSIFMQQRQEAQANHSSTSTGMILHKSTLIKTYAETKLKLTTRIARPVSKKGDNSDAYQAGVNDGRAYKAGSTAERSNKLN